MKNYRENIDYLKRNTSVPHSRYFEFDNEDNVLFNNLYQFYQANLERQHIHHNYNIDPSYLYFIDSSQINALATPPKEGIYLLGISRGLMELFDTKLNRYFDIKDYESIEGIKIIQDCIQNSVGELMYQTLTHFTFYHELGHLIEFSQNTGNSEKEEKLNGNKDSFLYEDHLKEADADLFASICVGTHLFQYFAKYFTCDWTEDLIKYYLSILSSSIFTYFLSFEEYHENLYFEEKTHPHPLVRLFYSLEVIVDYFAYVLKQKKVDVNINQSEVLLQTFKISEIMIQQFFDERKFVDFQKIVTERHSDILDYKNKLKTDVNLKETSAVNERNRKLKPIK